MKKCIKIIPVNQKKMLLKNNINKIVLQLHSFITLHKENYTTLPLINFKTASSYT